MFAILFGLCFVTVSGLIGFIMDAHFHINAPSYYWLLGLWSGVIAKAIHDKGANSK